MVPMVVLGLVGVTPATALAYPARYLFAFLDNHGMLSITGSPGVAHGHRRLAHLRGDGRQAADSAVATATPVRAVIRHADGVEVRDDSRPGDASSIGWSSPPTPTPRCGCWPIPPSRERSTLGAFGYSRNETWLHTDDSPAPGRARRPGLVELPAPVLPRRTRTASWSPTT